MEWVVLVIAVPLLALAGLYLFAWLLPVHVISRRNRDFIQAPEQLWQVLTNYEAYPLWRRKLLSTTRVPSSPHEEIWRENYGRIGLTLRAEIEQPGRVLLRHVVGRKLDFGGVWRFELEPQRLGGTRLSITEAAEYYRPLHRFVARYIIGEGRAIEAFLADLAQEMARQNPIGHAPTSRMDRG